MSTKTNSVPPANLEEAFAAPATQQTPTRRWPSGTIGKDSDWREIAREALRRMTLADMLRLAVDALAAKSREEPFLQDVDNSSMEETAWILDIPVVAVESRLR